MTMLNYQRVYGSTGYFLLSSLSWLAGWWYTYPSEKWWSSPVGIMTFPFLNGKSFKIPWFQTTSSKPPTSLCSSIFQGRREEPLWGSTNKSSCHLLASDSVCSATSQEVRYIKWSYGTFWDSEIIQCHIWRILKEMFTPYSLTSYALVIWHLVRWFTH